MDSNAVVSFANSNYFRLNTYLHLFKAVGVGKKQPLHITIGLKQASSQPLCTLIQLSFYILSLQDSQGSRV